MQLRDLECQLAMAQFKRYAAGARISDEALEDLESHLVDCQDCQKAVRGLRPFASDELVESPAPTTKSASEQPTAPQPALKTSAFAIANLKNAPRNGNVKTLILSVTLALVLVAMSTLASNPTKLFGERAMQPGQTKQAPLSPAPAKPVVASASVTRPVPNEERPEAAQKLTEPPAPKTTAPVAEPARVKSAPANARRAPRNNTTTRRAPSPAEPRREAQAAPRSSNSNIRVYDENGRLIR